ncbi:TylF/MycF/NovP-related O-methyltransferase [Dyadobacter sp. 676]|uniref:TylF/MycF/NovP-related O-methyltransferase n=1 Tax=Dyadobacter sp. 676 TaxID=3088362 RepID=A0AAU8FRK9_9BACT
MLINAVLKYFDLRASRIVKDVKFIDDDLFLGIYETCKPFTMTSVERMYALYNAVKYVVQNKIHGSFVECGVWRGGSSMLTALTLLHLGESQRKLFLYDTYEGMPAPTRNDVTFRGEKADQLLEKSRDNKETSVWCLADIADVRRNMGLTEYPSENIYCIKGKVEDTIPANLPTDGIALLRLDTDWYESTHHELIHLYPILADSGVLIIDDYGHWAGCKKAVDEYFVNKPILLNRIDYTGRIGIKHSGTAW